MTDWNLIGQGSLPIASMYGIFTYIWLIFMVDVGKYTIHGCYGLYYTTPNNALLQRKSLKIIRHFALFDAPQMDIL